MTALRVGVAGLGTVGAGVVRLLADNAGLIAARAGRPIEVVAVSARDRGRARGIGLDAMAWHDDAAELARDPRIDVLVEVIGGSDGKAREAVEAALSRGLPVVTANKALLAIHGSELAATAEAMGGGLRFEAAVAGGIPAIKALREGLAANRFTRIAGILNGTCNYILSTMRSTGRPFAEVLAEAQAAGYAEADPRFDIDGIDTAHKLALLAAIAFGRAPDFDGIHVEGIRGVAAADVAFADQLGFRIKLLGIARDTAQGIEARVHPCMIREASSLARVDGVLNAVVAEGDAVGRITMSGRGAGAGPTASAVVADLIDLARGRSTPVFGVSGTMLGGRASAPIEGHVGPYYLRLSVLDRPGVIAEVAGVLRDHAISLESLLQRGRNDGESVPVVLTTHATEERSMTAALSRIAGLPSVVAPPALIRIEPIE